MYSKVKTYIPNGLEAIPSIVEASILPGLPSFSISGMNVSQCRQIESRLRSALKLCGLDWPKGRIIAAIAPAWLDKKSSIFDLPIAIALLLASEQIYAGTKAYAILGELGLNGEIRKVPGIYSCLDLAAQNNSEILILPAEYAEEAASLQGLRYIPVRELNQVLDVYRGLDRLEQAGKGSKLKPKKILNKKVEQVFASFQGQRGALRALKIALSGWHHLALLGSPGCGKTMLLSLAQYLLPPLEEKEWYELKKIYSASAKEEQRVEKYGQRPYLAPHFSVTASALSGGGKPIKPGLFTLAHRGILFLDEFTEYPARKLNLLRETLSERKIFLARAGQSVILPANFLLLAAANPCPCGYFYEDDESCTCTERAREKYLDKVSGAIWDRFHLIENIRQEALGEIFSSSAEDQADIHSFKKDVQNVWELAASRAETEGVAPEHLNAQSSRLNFKDDYGFSRTLLDKTRKYADLRNMNLRQYEQCLRLSRTIADLEMSEKVLFEHYLEALSYQKNPRNEKKI